MTSADLFMDPDDPQLLARLNEHRGELNDRMGVVMTAAGRNEMVATMPVRGNRQPAGLLHGGANAVLAETLGSMHAALLAPAGHFPVGIELNCSHHRSATTGTVTGRSRPLQVGRSLASFAIEISDEAGRRVATARLTCLYRASPGS